MHENREISSAPWSCEQGRSAKAINRTADMHVLEKSDCAVVPVNQPNKGGQPTAEAGEGRAQAGENIVRSHMPPTQSGTRRRIEFGRFAVRNRKQRGAGKPETLTFLGFTHFCGNLKSSGAFNVWRITAKKRMVAYRKNNLLLGMPECQAQNALKVGMMAEDVTPADHMRALAPGLARCIESFSVSTPKKGRRSKIQRSQKISSADGAEAWGQAAVGAGAAWIGTS
jgi:hypothetical protein